MKKSILGIFALSIFTLSSCGESIDAAALSQEVCDCYEKANGLPASDENRRAEQDKCGELSTANWEKVKGKTDLEKLYNEAFPCGM